jgi:hypothetical protein
MLVKVMQTGIGVDTRAGVDGCRQGRQRMTGRQGEAIKQTESSARVIARFCRVAGVNTRLG